MTHKYPNVIIAGAPKCGTSSLFFWLGSHPQVCASKVKETCFLMPMVNRYNQNLNALEHGLERYSEYFTHCQASAKVRLEATAPYIYYTETIEYIKQLPEMPKVIFVLRRPGERLYSHWRFNRYRVKNVQLSFDDYLHKRNIPPGWRDYIEDTHYINHLTKWKDALGAENVLVYQFEKLTKNKVGMMKQVARDLNIDPSFYNDFDFFHRNETVAVKNKKLHRLGLKVEPLVPQWLQEKIIPLYLKLNSGKTPPISEKDRRLREEANGQFAESNKKLAEEFPSIDLSLW